MDRLPVELRRQILDHCTLSSVKALRLVSSAWAALGDEYLLSPNFNTFPHRPDFQRLLAIAQHPVFSLKIDTLSIHLGEINEYHARHNSYFIQYMLEPEERLAIQTVAWEAYAWFRTQNEAFLPMACTSELLDPALRSLSQLKKVSVSLASCPFPEDNEDTELLRQMWRIPSTRRLPRVATTERFTDLLRAIHTSPSTVTELSHDRLPLEFFAQKQMLVTLLSKTFIPLRSLSLVIDYSDLPNNLHSSLAFQNLSHCVRSATHLRVFHLSFQGRTKVDISPLLQRISKDGFFFVGLHDLQLEGVSCTEDEMVMLVLEHKKTLRKLLLGGPGVKAPHQKSNGGVHLKEGSWKGLIEKVTAEMELESFMLQGDMLEMEGGKHFVVDEMENVEAVRRFVMD